ncbi:MAG: MBOAT family O-acyltransferase [Bacteroidota bacterium]|nr:MBOAT family O-acyltransferase [Bacteroidota bacterium]
MTEYLKDIFLFNPDAPLIFTRFYFWAFFTVVLAGYTIIHKRQVPRNAYLLIVSLFFYYKTSEFFFFLLIFSTITDYYIGRGIYLSKSRLKAKLLVALSVTVNLSVLAYYKYAQFFTDTFNHIFNTNYTATDLFAQWANQFAGTHFTIDKIILPVGISFFTFQTISYSIDIYRKKVKPVKNILDFGFYVSFFPQLVAGPIVRAAEFIPQIYKKYNVSRYEFGLSIFWILNGLLKKLFVADYIAVNFVDRVFEAPLKYGGFENLMAVYGYSIQVYADFSGYTDIAIGVALLMGFRLPVNFNSPYKALHTGEFWKRWHISLSTWLKDYLYIPLGGNRHGKVRTNFNLMLTMLLGGLWHGASWQFVIWGGLNGIGLVVYKYWRQISPFSYDKSWPVRFYAIFLTFNFITATRIWFRSQSMEAANGIMKQISEAFDFSKIGEIIVAYKYIFAVMVFALTIHWLSADFKQRYRNAFIALPFWGKTIVSAIVVFVIWQVRTADLQAFIYFQF